MRCDADDLYPAGRIRSQVEWLEAHPDHNAVCGPFSTIDNAGRLIAQLWDHGLQSSWDISDELQRGRFRTHLCTFAVRHATIDRAGGFREYFETAEDIDLMLRLADYGPIGFLALNSYFYRLHDASITHRQKAERRIFFEAMAKEFRLQRIQVGMDDLDRGSPPAPPVGTTSRPTSASRQIRSMLTGQSWRHLSEGRKKAAIGSAWRAVRTAPLTIKAWSNLLKILIRSVFPQNRQSSTER